MPAANTAAGSTSSVNQLTVFCWLAVIVIRRLRFVDAIRSPLAPLIAGVAAALAAWPVAILPVITAGTAVVFGIGTGLGTASGVKALKRGN